MTADAYRKPICKSATLTRSNTTATKLFSLPANSYVEEIIVHNYAAAVGATISIGTTTTATELVNAQSVADAGGNRVTFTGYSELTSVSDIYALIAGGAVAGGPFRVTVWFTTAKAIGLI